MAAGKNYIIFYIIYNVIYIQPVPTDILRKIDNQEFPEKFWDSYTLLIEYFMANCGASRVKVEKHRVMKLKKFLEKSCRNRVCAQFFETDSNEGRASGSENQKSYEPSKKSPFDLSFSFQYYETSFKRKSDGSYEIVRRPRN